MVVLNSEIALVVPKEEVLLRESKFQQNISLNTMNIPLNTIIRQVYEIAAIVGSPKIRCSV